MEGRQVRRSWRSGWSGAWRGSRLGASGGAAGSAQEAAGRRSAGQAREGPLRARVQGRKTRLQALVEGWAAGCAGRVDTLRRGGVPWSWSPDPWIW